MIDRFRSHLTESGLVPEGARVLVGYSGGADSTCLLHLLTQVGVDVVAAHLHHGQRPEAEDELIKCQSFAGEIGIPFIAGRADVPRMASELRIGLEEAGREARYGFFREAAYGMECELIATGHTLTDHIETVILNLTRGTGLSGLTGIPNKRGNIIRPILPFTREETEQYCKQHGFWTHNDPANVDLTFSRSRIRQQIVPELRLINERFDSAIQRLAIIADEEDRFLNGMAAAALERTELPLNGDLSFLTSDIEMRFSHSGLAHLPEVLRKRAIRLACEAIGSSLNFEQTKIASSGIELGQQGAITTEGGEVSLEWNEQSVEVRQLKPATPFRYNLTVPGETISDEFGWQFTAFPSENIDFEIRRASLEVALDSKSVRGSLYFRTAKTGDLMQPLGFNGRRKLSDLLSEAKLTLAARARLPIVCDLIGPIWAPGVCLDERVRPNNASGNVIVVRFGNLGSTGLA